MSTIALRVFTTGAPKPEAAFQLLGLGWVDRVGGGKADSSRVRKASSERRL
jgi:hypothetical protein